MKTINDSIDLFDIIVVGAGAAGMTAALYSLRAEKSVKIFECEGIGGQIASSPRVENFPSIKEISGSVFSDNLSNQIMDLGAEFEFEKITKLEKVLYNDKEIFEVTSEYDSLFYAKTVIIASGAKHRHIGVAGEEELIGKGVSYCATCDGAFYKGQDVCLIGDANSALQYAILLSNYCNKVYLNTLFDKFFGEKTLVDLVRSKENIIIEHNLNLIKFNYDTELKGLVFENTKTHAIKEFNVPACFIAIGQVPQNEAFSDLVDLDKGYIVTDNDMQTKTSGLYAVGDCRNKKIRQLTTAVNDGTIAAINACNYIDKYFK